jgi:4'-phosphopantetheinyl transferase
MTAEVRPLFVAGLREAAPDVHVALLDDSLAQQQREQALDWLTLAERTRYEAEPVGRAERFLTGRFLLRSLAAESLGCDPADVVVSATCAKCGGEHGQPRVATSTQSASLFASLSHSGDVHVAAVSQGRQVGIDIELVGMQPRELPPGVAALEEWTRLEALSKVTGHGLDGQVPDDAATWCQGFSDHGVVGTLALAAAI